MIILDVNKISKNFGYGTLFRDLSFSLNNGESISIVGPNGCGKSTLLKIIFGLEKADSGNINIKKDAKVAYLDQTAPDMQDARKVKQVLKETFSELNEMEQRIKKLEAELAKETPGEKHNKKLLSYCNLIERFSALGGYDIDVSVNIVCNGLGISTDMLEQTYNSLSGGEKTLIHLAKTLLLKPDLLLLDEPTNHLDIERIEWLEKYIKSFKGTTVTVSHDRYFLDRMSNKILEIDNGNYKIYNTNYTGYMEEKQLDFDRMLAEYKDQQIAIKRLEEQIRYFSSLGMAKNSSVLCDRAKILQNRVDRLKENAIRKPREQSKLKIGFNELRKSSTMVVSAKNLSVLLPDNKQTIIKDINLDISAGERIAIIGKNGSGKSTFIKAVMGQQTLPMTGEIKIGPSIKIGYLPQIINFENSNQTLLDYFKEETGVGEEKTRAILASFHFQKDDVFKRIGNLSGGERIKVCLAKLLQQHINTLIFDEPTNHIDIPTKEVLEEALQKFDKTLIFISHDRYFINKFADKVVEFKDGKATTYIGNYDYYKEVSQR